MPAQSAHLFVSLKKGDYGKLQSGENFKSGGAVKLMQRNLIKTGFLPESSADGCFGENTEKAINSFQAYAIKENRMKRKVSKIEITDKKLNQAQPDGVYGEKTHNELKSWVQNEWIKPVLPLRHGDFDKNGLNSTDRKRDNDDFHSGSPVTDAQKSLQSVDVYTGFAVDGWFHDKMKDAVTLFQEWAEKGLFLINGTKTDMDEKLTGHRKGVLCPKTQEHLQKVVDKGGKVPVATNCSSVNATISYSGSIPHIGAKAETVLKKIMQEATVVSVIITSTVRTPADQARIMYDNIVAYGVAHQKTLYGTNGDNVIDEYTRLKKDGKNATEIKKGMEDKINSLGPTTISKHCCNPGEYSIFDVAPSSIPKDKKLKFEGAIKSANTSGEVNKYFFPPEDPAYHLQVKL